MRRIACARNADTSFDHVELFIDDFGDDRGWSSSQYGDTVVFGDIDGDGRADVCGRGSRGVLCAVSRGAYFDELHWWSSRLGNAELVDLTPAYTRIALTDLDGDGRDDLCARTDEGIACARSLGTQFADLRPVMPLDFSDARGWWRGRYGGTIAFGDLDGDGRADVCGRGAHGLLCAEG